MLNMITTWGSCSQRLCVCTWPNLYTTVSTQPPFFCTSQQIFQQKTLCAHIQQPYSPTLLPLIQAHVYDLFVKRNCTTNPVLIKNTMALFQMNENSQLKGNSI